MKRKERLEKAMFHLEKVGLADWAQHLPKNFLVGKNNVLLLQEL